MVKCEAKIYCYEEDEAIAECSDCGMKYCDKCASGEGWNCDCIEPQNIVELKTTSSTGSGNKGGKDD